MLWKAIWHLALAGLLVTLAVCAWRITWAVETIPAMLDARIAAEMKFTREAAQDEIVLTRFALVAQISELRRAMLARVDRALMLTDRRLASIEKNAQTETAAMRKTVDTRLGEVTIPLQDLIAEYRAVPGDFKWATMQFWDCTSNPDCLENRWVSLSRAVEAAAIETQKQARPFGEAVTSVAQDSARTAANVERITRPDSWPVKMLKLIGPFLGGALFGMLK